MRAPLKKDFTHECSTVEEGYQNLINAVFQQAFDDLVHAIRKGHRMALQAKQETITFVRWNMEDDAAVYMKEAGQLKKWFRDVLPVWRDIDPQRIIKQAYIRSGVDFSLLKGGDER